MRTIKFRAFGESKKMILYSELCSLRMSTVLQDSENYHVMQFTGLFDGNGTEIYEDDIVRDGENDYWLIRWKDETAQFVADLIGENGNCFYEELMLDDIDSIVIGNRYENPDLLSQDKPLEDKG